MYTLLIIALVLIFLIVVAFLEKNSLCQDGFCMIYEHYFKNTTNYMVYGLIFIIVIIFAITLRNHPYSLL